LNSEHCYFNGQLTPRGEIRISPDDGGLLRGEGVFETLLRAAGRVHDVPAHLERLFAALDHLGLVIPESPEQIAAAIESVPCAGAGQTGQPASRLRITVSSGPPEGPITRLVTADPYQPPSAKVYRAGVAVVTARNLRLDSRRPLGGIKSISYLPQRLIADQAARAGVFDALVLNERERLVEGSRANVLLLLDGEWVTPPVGDGCLPGTVRRRLLEAGAVIERSIESREVPTARSGALTNSLVGVLPIGRLDGRPLRVGQRLTELRRLVSVPWGKA
jgi:branched-chain amino acid aminotransferase